MRILHLYPNLMNLYGDYGNVRVLVKYLNDLGIETQLDEKELGDNYNLKDYDFIYLPAAPSVAPRCDEKSDRLSSEYLVADNHLVLGNFAGLPSLTLPIGFKEGLPFGANVMGRAFEDDRVFQLSKAIENHTGLRGVYAKGE